MIFITKCLKSTELYKASGSVPARWNFWVSTCPHVINVNPLVPEFKDNWWTVCFEKNKCRLHSFSKNLHVMVATWISSLLQSIPGT